VRPEFKDKIMHVLFLVPTLIAAGMLVMMLAFMSEGIGQISWRFLSSSIFEGGIFEPIMGTFFLFLGTVLITMPIGIFAAIYLVEYAPRDSKFVRIVDQAINNLAGVPSIVIGLFGYTFFCKILGLGISLVAGWLTLTLMMLPIMIRGTEEALRMIPQSFREAAMALGATKWETVRDAVLPAAMPGILTSILLGVARVAGETAAIIFTASVLTMRGLPRTPLEPVTSLTFYLFVLLVAIPKTSYKVAFGVALVLFGIVFLFSAIATVIRMYYRRKWKW